MAIIDAGVTGPLLREAMEDIRAGLNPHPAGQKTLNVPSYDGEQVRNLPKQTNWRKSAAAVAAATCHVMPVHTFERLGAQQQRR